MSQEVTQNPITPETCFVPKTHEGKGRRTAVAPGATAARFLHYGRITLAAGDPPLKFNNNDHEVATVKSSSAFRPVAGANPKTSPARQSFFPRTRATT